MEPERHEVYERIPWETLQQQRGDRQWLVYAVAGAVVLGALAYSFTRNQPLPATPTASTSPVDLSLSSSVTAAPPPTVVSPLVVSEADLYAVDPERLLERAAAHAEWFAVEYMAYDGSDHSRQVVAGLLPAGAPLPSAPEGTQVFVDWARARSTTQTGPTSFEVEVVVRSLVSTAESGFVRQPPRLLTVPIALTDEGGVSVGGLPTIDVVTVAPGPEMPLVPVPEDVLARLDPEGEVLGGSQGNDGSWEVVVLVTGEDGVTRPVTVHP